METFYGYFSEYMCSKTGKYLVYEDKETSTTLHKSLKQSSGCLIHSCQIWNLLRKT